MKKRILHNDSENWTMLLNWLNRHAKLETPILVRTDDDQLKLLNSARIPIGRWYWLAFLISASSCILISSVTLWQFWSARIEIEISMFLDRKKEKVVFHRISDKIIRCGKLPCGKFVKLQLQQIMSKWNLIEKLVWTEWITGTLFKIPQSQHSSSPHFLINVVYGVSCTPYAWNRFERI